MNSTRVDVLAALNIDVTAPPFPMGCSASTAPDGLGGRTARPESHDPLSVIYAASEPKKPGKWTRLGRAMSAVRGLFLVLHLVSYFPFALTVVSAVGAGLAIMGGYSLNKAPDNEAGRAVARVAEAPKEERKSFVEKAIDKVAEPAKAVFEPVKEAAKRGVAKAEAKVEAVKEEATEIVSDAKETAVEKVEEVKESVGKIGEKLAAQPGAQASAPPPSFAQRIQANLPAVKPTHSVPRRKSRAELVKEYWHRKNRIEFERLNGFINQGIQQANLEYLAGLQRQIDEYDRASAAASVTARRGRP